MTPTLATVVAHAGGIDEIPMVAVPLLLFYWLKRTSRKKREQEAQGDDENQQPQA